MRTLKRSDTWNATANRFDYPQTPARVMLSLWPAGLPSNGKGTVDWAGGLINWNSQYMQNGYYFARFSKVTVQCYDPPSGAQTSGSKSYVYTDSKNPTNNTVQITDKQVILGSLLGTGDNPGTAPKSGTPQPTASVDTVPGGIPGGGARTEQTATAAAQASASGTGSSSSSSSGGSSGFNQGSGNSNGKGNAGSMVQPGLGHVTGGVLTIAVAVLGLLAL